MQPETPTPVKKKKDWKELRTVRLLQVSASQMEKFQLCRRKWWLDHVRKLPSPPIAPGTFGDVLHKVLERYLKADGTGRDTSGNAVNLYPDKWTAAANRYTGETEGEISTAEASVIQKLVEASIEGGVLERLPDREIEVEFTDTILEQKCHKCEGCGKTQCPTCGDAGDALTDGETCPDCGTKDGGGIVTCPDCKGDGKGVTVTVKGFVDYLTPDGIQDHKSTKNMKYAKSKNDLTKDVQMMTYGKQLLEALKADGKPLPEKIYFRHNVYCKDPNNLKVRKTEVFVTPEDVFSFWETLKVMAREMTVVRRASESWHHVQGPENTAHACNAYGGCHYRGICSGMESEEEYAKRMEPQISYNSDTNVLAIQDAAKYNNEVTGTVGATSENPVLRNSIMGLLDKLKEREAAVKANTSGAPSPAATQATALQQAQAPAVTALASAPATIALPAASGDRMDLPAPWADAGCRACGGVGMSTKGSQCPICDAKARLKKAWQSKDFDIQVIDPGTYYWKFKPQDNSMFAGAVPEIEGIFRTAVAEAPVKTEVKTMIATPSSTETHTSVVTTPAPAPAAAPSVDKRTRTRKSFTLVINALVTFGSGPNPKVTRLVDTFAALQMELAQAAGKSYYEIDAFKRRDIVMEKAETIAESFGTDYVVADLANGTPDLKALCEAIRPYAGVEVVGTV